MRTAANRFGVNRLYILGAGASYALTKDQPAVNHIAPLDVHFCRRISELRMVRRPKWVADSAQRIEDEYLHHIKFESTGLEELIRQQISDYEFINTIHPRRSKGKRSKEEYLDDLLHLMAYSLAKCRAKDEALLEDWLERTFMGKKKGRTPNRIVSFNYDTIIDDILLKWHSPQHLYFDNIRESPNQEPKRLRHRNPLLVKLHGSINWRCDEAEYKKLYSNADEENQSRTKTYNTNGCHFIERMWVDNSTCSPKDRHAPLIIPPLPQKPVTSIAIFRYLWTYAYEYLYEAKNITIVGYSLPPADTLAVSLFSKFRNLRLNHLTVIDPNEDVLGKWIRLFRRAGIKSHKVHYYPDFLDYIRSER